MMQKQPANGDVKAALTANIASAAVARTNDIIACALLSLSEQTNALACFLLFIYAMSAGQI